MKAKVLVVLLAAAAILGGYGLYALGVKRGMQMSASPSAQADKGGAPERPGDIDPTTGKKVLYWHDPMVPGQKFDRPGKSPFMDMQLVPVYADSDADQGGVTINPRIQQNLGIRTAEVTRGAMQPSVEAVGSVAFNERDVATVQARTNGYLERLYVRAPLDPVKKGQPLAELYAPEWVAAQEEYFAVKRMSSESPGIGPLLDGARQRMRLAGMTEDHIRAVETTGRIHPRLTVAAPTSGVIAELGAREGMTVTSGAPLFRINGLATVWINADVPESRAALVRRGSPVEVRTEAFPGMTFKGHVNALLPEVNPTTRTLKARVEIANAGNRLAPGMFATVNFTPGARNDVLLVPTEAVIATGKRMVVIVARDDGSFTPVNVEIGVEANGQTEIRRGLEAGEKVVTSGQFLLDSEASLRASAARMGGDGAAPGRSQSGEAIHHGAGKIEAMGKDEVTLSHGPIPSLNWPAMTMGFHVAPGSLPKDLRVGDTVVFDVRQKGEAYEITRMEAKK
ncbi:MAG: efflux RND transporter periplasmic adaptor subunit [Rhodospirillaceae bacterium]